MNMRDNNKTAHWVGHAILKPIYTDNLFIEKQVVDDVKDSSTSTIFEHSD